MIQRNTARGVCVINLSRCGGTAEVVISAVAADYDIVRNRAAVGVFTQVKSVCADIAQCVAADVGNGRGVQVNAVGSAVLDGVARYATDGRFFSRDTVFARVQRGVVEDVRTFAVVDENTVACGAVQDIVGDSRDLTSIRCNDTVVVCAAVKGVQGGGNDIVVGSAVTRVRKTDAVTLDLDAVIADSNAVDVIVALVERACV